MIIHIELKKKKIIFMLTFTKLAGPPLVLGQSHILLLNLSSR